MTISSRLTIQAEAYASWRAGGFVDRMPPVLLPLPPFAPARSPPCCQVLLPLPPLAAPHASPPSLDRTNAADAGAWPRSARQHGQSGVLAGHSWPPRAHQSASEGLGLPSARCDKLAVFAAFDHPGASASGGWRGSRGTSCGGRRWRGGAPPRTVGHRRRGERVEPRTVAGGSELKRTEFQVKTTLLYSELAYEYVLYKLK